MYKNIIRGSLIVYLLLFSQITDAEQFLVEKIEISGLQRISKEAVLRDLQIAPGQVFDTDNSGELLRELYATGFFRDIELGRRGNNIVINVIERPSIGSLTVVGVRNKSNIDKILRQYDLSEGRLFQPNRLKDAEKAIEQHYLMTGQYGVKVQTEVRELERNRVSICISVFEGRVARICEIKVNGNCAFSERTILKQFTTKTKSLMGLITKNDRYVKEKFEFDLENLRIFYLNHGYLNFQIDSTNVSLSPDKRNIFITICVTEGPLYCLNKICLAGDIPDEVRKELECLIDTTMCPGEVFSRQKIMDLKQQLELAVGAAGYYFAEAMPIPEIADGCHKVDLTYMINPKGKIYVRRIDILGNNITHDRVIRRHLRQMEGTLISSRNVERGKERILQQGFGDDVKVRARPVAGEEEVVDLVYEVQETKQSRFEINFGYARAEGFIYNVALSQPNFVGTGRTVNFTFNKSQAHQQYNMGYYNPYFTLDEVGFGWDAYFNRTNLSKTSDTSQYSSNDYGADLIFNFPLSEYDHFATKLAFDHINLNFDPTASSQIINFINRYGDKHDEFSLRFSLNHNSLDKLLFPTRGYSQNLGITFVTPIHSPLSYYYANYNNKWYYPLNNSLERQFILKINTDFLYGNDFSRGDKYPFYRHFFSGGAESVRGYQERSLGPKDSSGRSFGGNLKLEGSVSLIFPNPIAPDSKSVRTAIFLDAGQVYDTHTPGITNPNGLRYSAGFSLVWHTPLGAPVLFNFAQPLNFKKDIDKKERFSFTFTTSF